jgi:hypothetical protein
MDFFQCITWKCESNSTVNQATYSNGILTLDFDYNESMEGVTCNLSLAYNSSILINPTLDLIFTAVSSNAPLNLS